MTDVEQIDLEHLLYKRRVLQGEELARRRDSQSIETRMRTNENAISQILLTQHGLGRGRQVVYNGTRFLVDGMTILFDVNMVILTDGVDGHTPFDNACLASPEAEKSSRRYAVKLESISENVGKGNLEFWS